ILGIEPAVKPAVQNRVRSQNKVLVLATNLTLREEKFHNLVKKIDHHDIVEFLALPGLVELAEKFEFRKEKVIPYLKEALSAFDINRYGTIVLGCTHFSYFADSLQELFQKEIDIISVYLVKKIDHHDIVEFLALPGLVELAEKFEFRKEKVIPYLKEALSAFDINRYGTIVLGCTHFSYFADSLQELFPKEIDIISGNMGTAKNLKRILTATNRINEGSGDIQFLKSGQKIEDVKTLHQYKDLLLMLDHMI